MSQSDAELACNLAEKLQTLLSSLQDVELPEAVKLPFSEACWALDQWHRHALDQVQEPPSA
jgi:hypothetical protein